MKILIIAATKTELEQIAQHLNCVNNSAVVNRNSIYFAVTGVGINSTTYHLSKLLLNNSCDLVLNVGIAGSFSEKHSIGETLIVEREIFADWGVHTPDGFRTVFEENIVASKLPFNNNGELLCRHIAPYSFLKRLEKVKGITVNAVNGEPLLIDKVRTKFNPDIEGMEGAAFFYVCLMENIPFLEFRAISNKVEKRDKSRWDIPLAIEKLSATVISFLYNLL